MKLEEFYVKVSRLPLVRCTKYRKGVVTSRLLDLSERLTWGLLNPTEVQFYLTIPYVLTSLINVHGNILSLVKRLLVSVLRKCLD